MNEHYYTKDPKSQLKIIEIEQHVGDNPLKLLSASGLFSKTRFDKLSLLLVNNSEIKDGQKVLDFGCGYGLIGIALSKRYKIDLTFSDVNSRAVTLTKKNCKRHNITAKVIQSDSFEKIPETFDVILLNPPQTAGKDLCFRMIEESASHTNKNGSLQLVARHNKGGKTLSEKMKSIFGNVDSLVKSGGARVYISIQNSNP